MRWPLCEKSKTPPCRHRTSIFSRKPIRLWCGRYFFGSGVRRTVAFQSWNYCQSRRRIRSDGRMFGSKSRSIPFGWIDLSSWHDFFLESLPFHWPFLLGPNSFLADRTDNRFLSAGTINNFRVVYNLPVFKPIFPASPNFLYLIWSSKNVSNGLWSNICSGLDHRSSYSSPSNRWWPGSVCDRCSIGNLLNWRSSQVMEWNGSCLFFTFRCFPIRHFSRDQTKFISGWLNDHRFFCAGTINNSKVVYNLPVPNRSLRQPFHLVVGGVFEWLMVEHLIWVVGRHLLFRKRW